MLLEQVGFAQGSRRPVGLRLSAFGFDGAGEVRTEVAAPMRSDLCRAGAPIPMEQARDEVGVGDDD